MPERSRTIFGVKLNDAATDWRTGPPTLLGLAAAFVGLGLQFASHLLVGGVLTVVGITVVFTMPVLHDRRHLRRGEPPHAMWGAADRNRPHFLGGPRV
jgi:hypothetical protein